MLNDIQHKADIKKLVHTFYEKLLKETPFPAIFLEVAEVDILAHLDLMIDFWESVLFQKGTYKRNTLDIHLALHQKHRLEKEQFQRWLALFNQTVDELFDGEKATTAKDSARSIATIIKIKINDLDKMRLELNN